MPKKKYDNEKVNIVGRFFEDLTKAMVICERAPLHEGDFCIWNINSGVEVKASDANHEFRLPLHQVEDSRRISRGFPYDNFFFFLFCYKNPYIIKTGHNRITSLSQHSEKIEVRKFLAHNLSELYIIDMAIVEFLFLVCRISNKSIPLHPGVESLNIRPTYLKKLVDGGWKAIITSSRNLRVKSFDCKFKFNPDLLELYKMAFRINILSSGKNIDKLVGSFNPEVILG